MHPPPTALPNERRQRAVARAADRAARCLIGTPNHTATTAWAGLSTALAALSDEAMALPTIEATGHTTAGTPPRSASARSPYPAPTTPPTTYKSATA